MIVLMLMVLLYKITTVPLPPPEFARLSTMVLCHGADIAVLRLTQAVFGASRVAVVFGEPHNSRDRIEVGHVQGLCHLQPPLICSTVQFVFQYCGTKIEY